MGKKTYLSIFAAAILVFHAVTPSAAQGEREEGYIIGGGDVLEVNVWRNTDLSREVTVRPDGMISLPLIDDIGAAGMNVTELKEKISQALSEADLVTAPNVTVAVVQATSYRVYTLGALVTNSMFPLSEPVTALQLLAQAGGPTAEADLGGTYILRGKVRIQIDLTLGSQERIQPLNPWLVPGDVLVVPLRETPDQAPVHRILVAGEVVSPVAIPFEEGITVLDAFVQAGGGTEFADTDSLKVIRREEGMEDRVIDVDLKTVMKKGDLSQNIILFPGDIVIVP